MRSGWVGAGVLLVLTAIGGCGGSEASRAGSPSTATSTASTTSAASAGPSAAPAPTAPADRAPVRWLSFTDPAGDVDVPGPAGWWSPSIDVTGFDVGHDAAAETFRFRVAYADLKASRHDGRAFRQSVTVTNDLGGWQEIYVERDPWRGTSIALHVPTGAHPHFGGGITTCAGATSELDEVADTMLLSVPVACLAPGGSARFTLASAGAEVYRHRRSERASTDQLVTTRRVRTRTG